MASSVARMPADDWRSSSSSSSAAAAFASPFSTKNLRKVFVRERPSSSSCSSSSAAGGGEEVSPPTADRRRQTQILDRWAARQAREMITTIERQAHHTELSAVSARAATFNVGEPSPSPRSSTSSSGGPTAAAPDLPPNVRASSLIQMWRELEAEAGITPTHRTTTGGGSSSSSNLDAATGNAAPVSPSSDPSGSSDSEQFGDWDLVEPEPSPSLSPSPSPSLPDSERGRVENIVRMLTGANTAQSSVASSWADDNAPLEHTAEAAGLSNRDCFASPRANLQPRVRGRKEIEDLMVRLEQERRREIDKLAERQAVSRFSHRGRIQSMLRFMSLRRETAAHDRPRAPSRTFELNQLQKGASILSLREKFNLRGQHDGGGKPPAESSSSSHIQVPDTSRVSGSISTYDQFTMQRFNQGGQQDRNSEPAVDNSSSLNIQFIDNSRDTCTSFKYIRQIFNRGGQNDGSREPAAEVSSNFHVEFPDNSPDSGYTRTADQFTRKRIHPNHSAEASAESSNSFPIHLCSKSQDSGYTCYTAQFRSDNMGNEEVTSPRDPECTLLEVNSPQSRSEDLQEGNQSIEDLQEGNRSIEDPQEGNQSIDGSWDERNLWVSNLDWQRPMDSPASNSWQGEVVPEELEPDSQHDVRNTDDTWINDSSNSWRTWDISRRTTSEDFLENFSDNVEIRELLERRRVTTSLSSGFREKMNRLIISFLQKQRQYDGEEDEEQFVWGNNDEFHSADQDASASSSLVPLPYQDSWHASSIAQNSSPHLLEMGVMNDLKGDVSQIHREIYELRKLVESCMDWQSKLQTSIKQEISGAIRQSVRIGDNSNWTPIRKGSCCICCEMPVDSLLYRCGHMCTCYKCAHELQWSSGRCPICRAPIVDVVRAYSNS